MGRHEECQRQLMHLSLREEYLIFTLAFTNPLLVAGVPGASLNCVFDGSLQTKDAVLREMLT